jgi:translation initiation factor 3 subunit I
LGWTIGDEYLIAGFDSGLLIKYDAKDGKEVMRKKVHDGRIHKISFNREKSMAVTASKDCTAKLIDPATLDVIKSYKTDRPVNGAAISPTHPHIILGGGQDAQNVTTTSASHGKFESRFFHMIYEEEFGRVKGHFGPINALDVHPFGKSFCSGSEDG